MDLHLDPKLASNYKSPSQKIRVLTEGWVNSHAFCPNCAKTNIDKFKNNTPAADFSCPGCGEIFELKSQKGNFGNKIVNGAYEAMTNRLKSRKNPNFFLLNYHLKTLEVFNFFVIPKYFFVPEIIERRKPLSQNARRAGWVGCNILLNHIPNSGKIFFVKNRIIEPKNKVLKNWERTLFLNEKIKPATKGWIIEIMKCIESLNKDDFSLKEIYKFEKSLRQNFPRNKHIRDKIRQQLQGLRDKSYLEFLGRGRYKLIKP